MTHSRAKAFACLRFIVQLLANQIVQLVLDFDCIVAQIDSKSWLAQVRLLLHLNFEETRLHSLLNFASWLVLSSFAVLTFELVNCFSYLLIG